MRGGALRMRRMSQRGSFHDRGLMPRLHLAGSVRHPHRPDAPAWGAHARTRAPRARRILHPGRVPQLRQRHRSARCAEGDVTSRRAGAGRRMRTVGDMRGGNQLRHRLQHNHGILPHVGGVVGPMQHPDIGMPRGHRVLRRTQMLQARRISRHHRRCKVHRRCAGCGNDRAFVGEMPLLVGESAVHRGEMPLPHQ